VVHAEIGGRLIGALHPYGHPDRGGVASGDAHPEEARRVESSDDLPGDLAAEPIAIDGPAALLDLGAALGVGDGRGVERLRDATCRSYPVWALSRPLCSRLESLGDDEIDDPAAAWHTREDADLFERASCLRELRDALRARDEDERCYALLEERAS